VGLHFWQFWHDPMVTPLAGGLHSYLPLDLFL
jgi:hypothetical protein